MKAVIAACSLALAPMAVQAGDPCPIPVNIVDLGTPDWLNRDDLLGALRSQQPSIGIQYRDTPQGIVLTQVDGQGPAEAAGLQVGDLVTEINGIPAHDTADRQALLDGIDVGDVLTVGRFAKPEVIMTVGQADPVAFGFAKALEQQECRSSSIRVMDPQDRATVLPLMFNPNRSFRCDDAHRALEFLGDREAITDVYFVRGSRRLLISMPYWGSACLIADDLDGNDLTDDSLLAAIDKVAADYVQDRIDNP